MDSKLVSLKYNGITSADFGAKLNYPMNIIHAKHDLAATSIPGVSGDYIADNKKYLNIVQPLTFYVERPLQFKTWEQLEFEFTDWLTDSGYTTYQPFYLDQLNPYHWLGYISEAPVWTVTTPTTATVAVTLNCKPFIKYDDLQFQSVPNTIVNTEHFNAQPVFHIVGDGAVTLSINDIDYELNPIDSEVYVDSEHFLIYKSLAERRGTIAKFPNNDFPELKPGVNEVKITGKVAKFEYIPNWRRLL